MNISNSPSRLSPSSDSGSSSSEGSSSVAAVTTPVFANYSLMTTSKNILLFKTKIENLEKTEIDSKEKIETLFRGMEELGIDLFDPFGESTFFSKLASKSTPTALTHLLCASLLSKREKSKELLIDIKKHLLSDSFNGLLLGQVLRGARADEIFDNLFDVLECEDANHNQVVMSILTNFAYKDRYNYLFFQDSDFGSVKGQTESCRAECSTTRSNLQEMILHEGWLAMRSNGSTTLAGHASPAWMRVNAHVLTQKAQFSLKLFEEAHRIMMKEELAPKEGEVDQRGKFRSEEEIRKSPCGGIVRTGTQKQLYCLPDHLKRQLNLFEGWMQEGISACDAGKRDCICFAAQVYQRVTSLHPFMGGNGRIARLAMDWVLTRYNIPPPILDGPLLAAVFPLMSKEGNPSRLVHKIVEGIIKSKNLLNTIDLKQKQP